MTITHEFPLLISYGQVSVFNTELERPFNDWTQAHTDQGFSWRPDSVSFGTLPEAESVLLTLLVTSRFQLDSMATRVIEVPFEVSTHGSISVASILDEHSFPIAPGSYQLLYEAEEGKIRLTLSPSRKRRYQIHRKDSALASGVVLTTTAEPA